VSFSQPNFVRWLTRSSFTSLNFAEKASFKAQSSFSKVAVERLLSLWNLNSLFVFDLLGRPDYWSPEVYSYADSEGNLERIG
jgi:hypothetical protein